MSFVTRRISAGATLCLPADYKADSTRTGIIGFHGRDASNTNTGLDPVDTGNSGLMYHRLAALGYPIIATQNGGNLNWGNAASQTQVSTDRTTLQSTYKAKSGKVILLGISMGAMAALRWAKDNPTLTAAVLLFSGAVNLATFHANALYTSEIETAYGGAAAYTAAQPSADPAANAANYASIPVRAYQSTDDPLVDPSIIAAFVAAVDSPTCTTVSQGAQGHTPAPSSFPDAAAWLASVVPA